MMLVRILINYGNFKVRENDKGLIGLVRGSGYHIF